MVVFIMISVSDDRMLVVVGVVGVPQLGISYMIGGLQHHRYTSFCTTSFSTLPFVHFLLYNNPLSYGIRYHVLKTILLLIITSGWHSVGVSGLRF